LFCIGLLLFFDVLSFTLFGVVGGHYKMYTTILRLFLSPGDGYKIKVEDVAGLPEKK
jgi:hypothetical protein